MRKYEPSFINEITKKGRDSCNQQSIKMNTFSIQIKPWNFEINSWNSAKSKDQITVICKSGIYRVREQYWALEKLLSHPCETFSRSFYNIMVIPHSPKLQLYRMRNILEVNSNLRNSFKVVQIVSPFHMNWLTNPVKIGVSGMQKI